MSTRDDLERRRELRRVGSVDVILGGSSNGPHYWGDYLDPEKCAMQLNQTRTTESWAKSAQALREGMVGHAMLEQIYRGNQLDPLRCTIKVAGTVVTEDYSDIRLSVASHKRVAGSVVAVEHLLKPYKLGGIMVGGRIDLAVNNGGLWVVDHKFYRWHPVDVIAKLRNKLIGGLQLSTYCLLLEKEIETRVEGAILNILWKGTPFSTHMVIQRDELKTEKELAALYRMAGKAQRENKQNFKACKRTCPKFRACMRGER